MNSTTKKHYDLSNCKHLSLVIDDVGDKIYVTKKMAKDKVKLSNGKDGCSMMIRLGGPVYPSKGFVEFWNYKITNLVCFGEFCKQFGKDELKLFIQDCPKILEDQLFGLQNV